MQYWVVIYSVRTELHFIQFYIEKWKPGWFCFLKNQHYLMLT